MVSEILGVLDIAAAIIIFLVNVNVVKFTLAAIFAAYLIIKAIIFFGDFLSIIDGLVGIYILLMFTVRIDVLTVICVMYLIAKGGISVATSQ
jgi:hypothetical protein